MKFWHLMFQTANFVFSSKTMEVNVGQDTFSKFDYQKFSNGSQLGFKLRWSLREVFANTSDWKKNRCPNTSEKNRKKIANTSDPWLTNRSKNRKSPKKSGKNRKSSRILRKKIGELNVIKSNPLRLLKRHNIKLS